MIIQVAVFTGMSGNFKPEWVAVFTGMSGRFGAEYADV